MSKSHLTVLTLVAVAFASSLSWAQEPLLDLAESVPLERSEKPADVQQYWLGVGCSPAPEGLRAQMELAEDTGLLVEHVAAESPAAAKLKVHDVLVKADGKPLHTADDLIDAVQAAQGRVLSLEIVRQGKPRTVEISPAKRPAAPPIPSDWKRDLNLNRAFRGNPEWERLFKILEQAESGDPSQGPLRLQFMRPGVLLPPGAPAVHPMPDDMTVRITKQGSKPAEVVVTQKDKKWETTEDRLDRLPDDVRPHVERLLGRFCVTVDPLPDWRSSPDSPRPQMPDMEKQLHDMNRQLEQLRRALEDMQQHNQP